MTYVSPPKPAALKTSGRAALTGTLLAGAFGAAFLPSAAMAEENLDDHVRGEIVVSGDRPDVNINAADEAPYKIDESTDGKFTAPVRDTPKTQTIIPKEVIEDIGATSFREIVRSTPGVTLGTGEGGNAFGDRIFIRGFEARGDVYIDGLRDPGVTSRELFAVEQIEVVKGPSAVFGGRGTTGGLVSLQSKRAQFGNDFAVIEAGVGTENYYRGTLDTNVQVGDNVALRFNGLYHDADTPGRDFVGSERYGATIAGTLQVTDTLAVMADYYFYRLDGVPEFGHPFNSVTQQPYLVDRDNFYGVVGRDFIKNGADIGTVQIEWQPIPELRIHSITRYGETYNRYAVSEPSICTVQRDANGSCPRSGGVAAPESEYTVSPALKSSWRDNSYWANSTYAVADITTGSIDHTLVIGGDFADETIEAFPLDIPSTVEDENGNIVSIPGGFVYDLFDPQPELGFDIPIGRDDSNGPTVTNAVNFAAYAIDTIKFSDAFQIVLGGRVDTFDIDYFAPASATRLTYSEVFFNGQASLVFKPAEPFTLYASYSTSSNPSGEQLDGNGASYDGISEQTIDFSPEQNTSIELGAKGEFFDGHLLLTAAGFRIEKDNARESGGRGQPYTNVGTLRSQGIELSANGTLWDSINIFAGYTYTDAEITASADPTNVGRRFANIPQHTAQLLTTVSVTSKFEIGGQVYAQDEMFGGTQLAGTAKVPGYVRFDAVARYALSDNIQMRLNVLNVTDKRYYDAIYRSGSPFAYIAPGRSAFFTLTGTF